MSVTWRFSLYKQKADKVKEELDKLGDSYTMHDVVDMARPKDHYMHDMFEWDDAIAGEKYREEQARKIVHMLVFTEEETEKPSPVRVFYSSPAESKKYEPTQLIFRKPDEHKALLETAIRELQAFKRKYQALTELSEVFDAIDAL